MKREKSSFSLTKACKIKFLLRNFQEKRQTTQQQINCNYNEDNYTFESKRG